MYLGQEATRNRLADLTRQLIAVEWARPELKEAAQKWLDTMEDGAAILKQLQDCLREHFPVSVQHTTFQLEPEGYDSPSADEMHR